MWSAGALADDASKSAATTAVQTQRPNRNAAAAPAAASRAPAAHAAATAQHPLDLSAPPANHVMTPKQLQSFLDSDSDDGAPPEEVTVKQEHYLDPIPAGAFGALPWALLHPLEAWRIFTPVTSD
jgi:hypothetical protein